MMAQPPRTSLSNLSERHVDAPRRCTNRCISEAIAVRCFNVLESAPVVTLMMLNTVVSLYLDDICKAFLPPTVDGLEDALNLTMFALFTFELIGFSLVKGKYFGRLYFWLDLVSASPADREARTLYKRRWRHSVALARNEATQRTRDSWLY